MNDCLRCKKHDEMPHGARCQKCDNGSLFIPRCNFCERLLFIKYLHKKDKPTDIKVRHKLTSAIVDETYIDGDARGKSITYTWTIIKYCPYCGRKF